MNLLNNILLRVENYSTTYILLIDFVICLVLSVIISLLGSLLVIKHKDTIRYSFVKSFKFTLYLVIWSYFIKTCVDLPV